MPKSLYVLVDARPSPESIKAVAGVLAIHFLRTNSHVASRQLFPAQHAEAGDVGVTVTARGRRALTLKTDSGGERVLYVKVSDPEDQPVLTFSPNVTESPDGAWRFELAPQGGSGPRRRDRRRRARAEGHPFRLEPK